MKSNTKNVGVEGGHKGEELVERQTAKAIRSGIRHHKMKPYKAVEKAERQLMSANAEYFYQKSLRDNPQIAQAASNPFSRMCRNGVSNSSMPKLHGRPDKPPRRVQPPPQRTVSG